MPGDDAGSGDEVLAGLVASLRAELAESQAALARAAEASGRKPGGQDGHQGTTLAQVARPDQELRHEPG